MNTTSSLEVISPHISLAYYLPPAASRSPSPVSATHFSNASLSLFGYSSATARLLTTFRRMHPRYPPSLPPEVAIAYALGGGSGGLRGRRALLFKLRANSFIDRGADLSYCSCFAAEAEAHLSPYITLYLPIALRPRRRRARACHGRPLCTRGTRQHTRSTHSTGRKAQRRWRHSPRSSVEDTSPSRPPLDALAVAVSRRAGMLPAAHFPRSVRAAGGVRARRRHLRGRRGAALLLVVTGERCHRHAHASIHRPCTLNLAL